MVYFHLPSKIKTPADPQLCHLQDQYKENGYPSTIESIPQPMPHTRVQSHTWWHHVQRRLPTPGEHRLHHPHIAALDFLGIRTDIGNAFAETLAPTETFYMKVDEVFLDWWELPWSPTYPTVRREQLQRHPKGPWLWHKHIDKNPKGGYTICHYHTRTMSILLDGQRQQSYTPSRKSRQLYYSSQDRGDMPMNLQPTTSPRNYETIQQAFMSTKQDNGTISNSVARPVSSKLYPNMDGKMIKQHKEHHQFLCNKILPTRNN